MPIYYGLNINKAMADIGNNRVALGNLGLRIENLDLIKGLSDVIDIEEFHTLSGLVDDQKSMIGQLDNTSKATEILSSSIPKIDVTQEYNYSMSDRLLSGTIKYNYIDFNGEDDNNNPDWVTKGADISTSRVSSWSPFGPEEAPDELITYNSDILIKGEFLGITQLGLTSKPEARRFDSEVPTNTIRLNINGQAVDVLAMRGIPFKLRMKVQQPNLSIKVTEPPLLLESGNRVPITIVRQDINTGQEILGNNNNAIIEETPDISGDTNIRGNVTENTEPVEEDYKIYYNPSKIEGITAFASGIETWPEIVMEGLKDLRLAENPIEKMPNFDKYAPNLEILDMSFTPLYNMDNYQNENNLNSDGTVFSGGLQGLVNRLPPTMLDVDFSLSLGGDRTGARLDLRKFRQMERFALESSDIYDSVVDSLGTVSPTYLTMGYDYPLVADPATRFDLKPSNTNPDNGATFDLATGIITQPLHGFADDDTVLYDVHLGPTEPPYDQLSFLTLLGTLGTAMGGLTAGNKYKIDFISINEFKLKNLNDTTSNTLSITSVGSGNAHSITKWDTTKNDIYLDPTTGFKTLQTNNNDFRYITDAVLDSPRLKEYTMIKAENLLGRERGKYVQQNTYGGALLSSDVARVKQLEDSILNIRSEILTHFHQDDGSVDVPDFSKWRDTLKTLTFENVYFPNNLSVRQVSPTAVTSWYPSPASDLNTNKFDLNAIQSITLRNLKASSSSNSKGIVLGNMIGFMANKPSLTSVLYHNVDGPNFELNDDALSGSTSLSTIDIKLPYARGENYLWANNNVFGIIGTSGLDMAPNNWSSTASDLAAGIHLQKVGLEKTRAVFERMHDFLGVSGSPVSNKTAKVFDPVLSSLTKLKLSGGGGDYEIRLNDDSFGGNDPRSILLSDFSVLDEFKLESCSLAGKIPSFENCNNLAFFTLTNSRSYGHPLSMKPGNIYSVSGNYHNQSTLEGRSYEANYLAYGAFDISGQYHAGNNCISDYRAMGYDLTKTNADFVPWGDSDPRSSQRNHGSTGITYNLEKLPARDNAFAYKYIDADDAVSGHWYTIADLGNTTAQQWLDLGVLPGVTPEVGMQFKARNFIDDLYDQFLPSGGPLPTPGIKLNVFNIRDTSLARGPTGAAYTAGSYVKVWRVGGSRGTQSSVYNMMYGYGSYPGRPGYQPPDGVSLTSWPDDYYSNGKVVQMVSAPASASSLNGLRSGQRGHYVERMPTDRNSFGTAKLVKHAYKEIGMPLGGFELDTNNANNEITGIGSLQELTITNTNFYTNNFPVLKQEIFGDNPTKNLISIDLQNNRLHGSLPDFRNVEDLKTINLSRNQFDSYISGAFSQLTGALITINLSNNRLTGQNGVDLFNDLYDVYLSTGETLTGVTLNLTGQDTNEDLYRGTGSVENAGATGGNSLIINGTNTQFTTEISAGQYIRIEYRVSHWLSSFYYNDFSDGAITAWLKVASVQSDTQLTLAEVPPGVQIDDTRNFDIQTKNERLSEKALEDNDAALGSPDDSAFEKFKTLNTRWSILIDYDSIV